MSKKIIALILSVILMLLPISLTAVSDTTVPTDDILDTSISAENIGGISVTSAAAGISSGYIYNIKNVNSGKYLNVHVGIDANGTNIYQWTKDGSTEQKFKVVYSSATDSYKFYAMCSSSGANRVLSVNRGSAAVSAGQNAHLYIENNPTAQRFNIISLGSGKYRIQCKANTNLYLAAYGTSNGTSGGTASTSAGNVYLASYANNNSQIWTFESLGAASAAPPKGYFDRVTSVDIAGWAWRTDLPDTALDMHIYIKNNSTGVNTVYTTKANVYRSDLAGLGYGNGYHGFLFSMNWLTFKPGSYTVTPYAIGANGYNPAIQASPKTFTVRNCAGNVEYVSNTGIGGWVWKPDAPNSAIGVHIYIRNSANESVAVYTTTANVYRSDLASAGYGNGYHAFSKAIDWSTLPEENLRVTVYAVDNSGYHPAFYDGYYDNRRPINLIGMTDENGIIFSSAFNNDYINYCLNIGCTEVNVYSGANYSSVINLMREASFCAVSAHGGPTSIACWVNGNKSYLTSSDISALSDDYFDGTRCVLLNACNVGSEGSENDYNLVNKLHQKGVETVVGFTDKITFYFDEITKTVDVTQGCDYWMHIFTQKLGNGETVETAANNASQACDEMDGLAYENVYIAGNKQQVVKH